MFDCEPMAGDMDRADEPPPPGAVGAPGEGAGRSGDCCGAGGVPAAPRTAPAGLRAGCSSSGGTPPALSSDCCCCCCCCCC